MGKKQRYELKELGNGTFAYALKSGMPDSEPEHSIRAGCCTKAQKSILQPETLPGPDAGLLLS